MNSVISVSSLIQSVKANLESSFPVVQVEGEITNIPASSNHGRKQKTHWYFSLKDENIDDGSQINCVMFAQYNYYLNFVPENGFKVIVTGKITVYEKTGRMQLNVTKMQLAGYGILEQRFRELEIKLRKEGLFNPEIKRPLPAYPQNIGIITSNSGLAIVDMLRKIYEGHYPGNIIIYPALVQGIDAPESLIRQIVNANNDNYCDVLIIGRGGGSYEDLFCFNDENLVRTLRNSRIPIISAIGHTEDTSLCDYASDYHATTPTDAGNIVTINYAQNYRQLPDIYNWLVNCIYNQINNHYATLSNLANELSINNPSAFINSQKDNLRMIESNLTHIIEQIIQISSHDIELKEQMLQGYDPKKKLLSLKDKLSWFEGNLLQQMKYYLDRKVIALKNNENAFYSTNLSGHLREKSNSLNHKLHELSQLIKDNLNNLDKTLTSKAISFNNMNPLISSKYVKSITQKDGKVLSSINDVKKDDIIVTQILDGKIISKVIDIKNYQ